MQQSTPSITSSRATSDSQAAWRRYSTHESASTRNHDRFGVKFWRESYDVDSFGVTASARTFGRDNIQVRHSTHRRVDRRQQVIVLVRLNCGTAQSSTPVRAERNPHRRRRASSCRCRIAAATMRRFSERNTLTRARFGSGMRGGVDDHAVSTTQAITQQRRPATLAHHWPGEFVEVSDRIRPDSDCAIRRGSRERPAVGPSSRSWPRYRRAHTVLAQNLQRRPSACRSQARRASCARARRDVTLLREFDPDFGIRTPSNSGGQVARRAHDRGSGFARPLRIAVVSR